MRRASVRVTRAGRHAKRGADGAARAHNKNVSRGARISARYCTASAGLAAVRRAGRRRVILRRAIRTGMRAA